MAIPLIVLAVITLVLGFAKGPLEHFLLQLTAMTGAHGGGHSPWLPAAPLILALAGVGLAWLEFGRGASKTGFVERVGWLKDLFAERWYLDRFYRWFLDRVIYGGIARLLAFNDNRVIDGGIDGLSQKTVASGRMLSRLHGGMVQFKLLVIFAVMVLVGAYFFFLS
jgi:NADH-quinone oxidoreductase subunit L